FFQGADQVDGNEIICAYEYFGKLERPPDSLFQCFGVCENCPAGKLGGTRIKPVCAECVHKALISLEEGAAVFRIPGKCKAPASILDQCIRKVKDAQMIFHEQKIRIDLCHVSIGGCIEKEERDTES